MFALHYEEGCLIERSWNFKEYGIVIIPNLTP
jgi:hypothetical protein